MKFNKKILMISAATLMLVSPVTSLANANTVSAASVKKVSYAKQTTVTVKKKTPQLFMATGGRALTTGKYYKKGQKLTVDQLGGMNILANSSPDAYRIKGTDYYVWAKDVKAKHALQDIDYTSRGLTTVRTNMSKAPLYSFDAEKSTPAGYAFMKGTDFKVNGAMYLYNAKTDKSELYYHLTNHYHTMANLKTSPDFPNRFNTELVDTGDAFVKASDVNFFSGKKLKPINTADSAKDGSKIAILENQEADLKDLLGKVDSVKHSVKYKLSSSLKRDNYDLAVRDAQTQVNSRKSMSTTEAQYLIWSLKTYENELDGAKVKVGTMNKLTSNEKLAIGLLVISVYGKNTDKESLYGYAKFNKGNDKTFTLTIEDMHNQNKVVSTKTIKTSDFAQKR